MKGSHGHRRRTRDIKAKLRDRGKPKIRKYLQDFKENESVSIVIDPSYQAIPHPRFQGRTGKIVSRQGRAYCLEIKDGGKTKNIIVTPEHLTKSRK
jgi:large subunit ribosomal protein L21e